MVLHFDGRYRSDFECKFLEQVEEELTSFWNSCSGNSVLVFPPLTPRYRFLIHQLVGVGSRLQTVSIGQGRQRRTVVYFATKREPEKMAQPPSTSQRTFFGRGRGRRPKRPDQPLYVPGALRQAKLNQLKENKDVESSTNITENKEISKSNKNGNSSMHEEIMDRSSYNNELFRGVDSITEGTDGTSFINTNVQQTNRPSLLSESVNKRLQSKNREPNREIMAENDKGLVVAVSEKSRKPPVIEYDNTRQVKVKREDEQVVRTEESTVSIDDQSNLHLAFGPESSNDGSDRNSDVVVNCGISQTLSTAGMIGNDSASVDDSLLTYAAEKSDDLYESEKLLVQNVVLPRQNSGLVNSKTDCGSATTLLSTEESKSLETGNQSSEDVPSLEANGDTILVEQSMENKEESEANEKSDCSLVNIVSDKKAEQERDCSGNKVTFQSDPLNKENSEILLCTSGSEAFGHKEEQEHGITHPEDVSHAELTGNQLQMSKEEVVKETELRTSKVTLTSACKNINSENNTTVTLDNDQPPSSIHGHVNLVSVTDETVQAMSEKTEAVSVPIGELETEQQKTSKKKKAKKDKGKDLKEDKGKSKEKGEKKRKKEKKSVKDKSDKEEKLDSEMQIKEENKSKTKEKRSAKQQDKKGASKCDIDTGEELTGESCGKSNDIEDDDTWEAIFDESGDCLSAAYLEELSRLTGISNPEVQKTQFDYYSFKPQEIELDDEEFGHIVEIYNFSSELKTQDLMQAFSSFRSKGFDIKWVDDTHALAVFASSYAAQDAIKLCSGPLMKLRPVSEGTLESKKKAHHCFEFLQPYRERPQTSKLLADRLVTGALGMRSKMTREERVKEREKLKEAKSKRDQEKTQKAQIWGD